MTSQNELFEAVQQLPDPDAEERLGLLVGIDDQKARLTKMLAVLVNPNGLIAWAKKHHPDAKDLANKLLRRPPLVVLEGDVGSGKTELAETIGNAVARQEDIDIMLYPLSLSSRGQGRVGEMTQLLSSAFKCVLDAAKKLKEESGGPARGGIIMLVDEADALAQSRENAQMHHEDRAGVNAFIRGIDQLMNERVPAAVIMCTNRIGALDPAVKRRAADILSFGRPDKEQRRIVLENALDGLGLSSEIMSRLVTATGSSNGEGYGYTFSDLVQRLVPNIILDAYPSQPVEGRQAIEVFERIKPTPPFSEQ